MIEALKDDKVITKVGGRFKFAALVQHRVRELMEGARPLVERHGRSDFEVAVQEIVEEKIELLPFDAELEAEEAAAIEQEVETARALANFDSEDFNMEADEDSLDDELAGISSVESTQVATADNESASDEENQIVADESASEQSSDEATDDDKPAE